MGDVGSEPKLVIVATPDAPMTRPAILRAVSASLSQIAEKMAPKRGDRAFRTDSTEAGTYRAAKEKRRKGSPELTRPMTMKRLQFLLHPSRKPVAAKKTRRKIPAISIRISAVRTGPTIGERYRMNMKEDPQMAERARRSRAWIGLIFSRRYQETSK
jgi:hypothetical protein